MSKEAGKESEESKKIMVSSKLKTRQHAQGRIGATHITFKWNIMESFFHTLLPRTHMYVNHQGHFSTQDVADCNELDGLARHALLDQQFLPNTSEGAVLVSKQTKFVQFVFEKKTPSPLATDFKRGPRFQTNLGL